MSDTNNKYDNARLKEFAQESINLINTCINQIKRR